MYKGWQEEKGEREGPAEGWKNGKRRRGIDITDRPVINLRHSERESWHRPSEGGGGC